MVLVRELALDIPFNDPFAQMHGAWDSVVSKLAIFSNIDERQVLTFLQAQVHAGDIRFLHSAPGCVANGLKSR